MATVAINDIDTTIGGDLGKNFFHIVGMNARGAMAANREPGSQETFAMIDGRRSRWSELAPASIGGCRNDFIC
jgi:hypothetical protein